MKKYIILILMSWILGETISTQAATCTASSSGDWNSVATWDCGDVPGPDDDVIIAGNNTVITLNTASNLTVNSLTINSSSGGNNVGFTGTGSLTITTDANFFNKGTMTIGADFTVFIGGNINYSNNGNGIINGTGGLSVTGCLSKNSGNAQLSFISSDLTFCIEGSGGCPSQDLSGEGNNGCSLLPITLIYFRAALNENQVDLMWATASEENNDFFTVEKSLDGINYTKIGEVLGAGESQHLEQYSLIDGGELASITYYRLKQTDYDGTFSYSKVIQVYKENVGGYANVFPNPTASNTFKVDGFNVEQLVVDVYTLSGKQIPISTHVNHFSWGVEGEYVLSNHVAGLVVVVVQTEKGVFKEKLLVK
ncbi:MAG: T9SS type A sorting domain-containing protein [Flammeovirgaceae bacterium]